MRNVARIVRWEWFKLHRRWMPWILLAILLVLTQLFLWGNYFMFQDTGNPLLYGNFTLPGSLSWTLFIAQSLGAVLIIILASSVVGSEYGWGTLSGMLVRGVGRWQFLTGKITLLLLTVLAALLVVVAVTAVSSLIAETLTGPPEMLGPTNSWEDAAGMLGRSWVALLPYVALVVFFTVLTGSSAAGMAVSLGYYFAEQIAVSILLSLFTWFETVADYLIGRNVNAWMMSGPIQGMPGPGRPQGVYPSEIHALIVILVYTAILGGLAFWLFKRTDITGGKGG